jgi:hypothetical protein
MVSSVKAMVDSYIVAGELLNTRWSVVAGESEVLARMSASADMNGW